MHVDVPAGFVRGTVAPGSRAALRYDLAPRTARWSTVAIYPWHGPVQDAGSDDATALAELGSWFGAETSAPQQAASTGQRGKVQLADGSSAPAWTYALDAANDTGGQARSYTMWLVRSGDQQYGVGVQAPGGEAGLAVRDAVLSSLGPGGCPG